MGRKAKQSHTPPPEVRHRTHSPAQRTPPAAGATASGPRSGRKTASNNHGGKDKNVGSRYASSVTVKENLSPR